MSCVYFITHPEVLIEPTIPVTAWSLSPFGRARMRAAVSQPWMARLGVVWCSTERKAIEAAEIMATAIGTRPRQLQELGENDRSSTGYLPKIEFEVTADAFFANSNRSVRGWETAADAQARIVAAIAMVLTATQASRDIALVAHGGVGALLLCHLKKRPISRAEDQPAGGGGNYFCFEATTRSLCHGWRPIEQTWPTTEARVSPVEGRRHKEHR